MGDLLRNEVMEQGSASEKWDMVSALVQKGEMAPEVSPKFILGGIRNKKKSLELGDDH